MHIGIDFLRLFKTFGLLKHLITTLGTFNGFLAIKGFQLGDYFLLMFNFLLLIHPGLQFSIPDLCFLLRKSRVVAAVHSRLMVLNLNNLGNNTIQKIPVMGNNDHGTLIILQKCLQPGNRLHIQMIRRFIQQNNIRFRQKQTSQGNSRFLSSRERRYLLIKILLSKTQSL